jgi:hypothetical protein
MAKLVALGAPPIWNSSAASLAEAAVTLPPQKSF